MKKFRTAMAVVALAGLTAACSDDKSSDTTTDSNASVPAHTEAIEVEPFDSMISDVIRTV